MAGVIDVTPRGPAGTPGLSILSARPPRDPRADEGREGEFWLNQNSTVLFRKHNSKWETAFILRGREGKKGQDGQAWFIRTGAPDNSLGRVGDYWLNKTTGDLFGPRSDSAWPTTASANLRGPSGTLPLSDPTVWVPATAYVLGPPASYVTNNGSSYAATVSHTSASTFAADLTAGKWRVVAAKGDTGGVGPQGVQGNIGPQGAVGPATWQSVPSTWATGLVATMTNPATTVNVNGSLYGCIVSHTAGATFAADLAAGKWSLLASKGDIGNQGSPGPTGALAVKPVEDWANAVAYTAGPPASFVQIGGSSYLCLVSHTSGTFSVDLSAGKWGLVAAKGTDGGGSGNVSHQAGSFIVGDVAVFTSTDGTQIGDGGKKLATAGDTLTGALNWAGIVNVPSSATAAIGVAPSNSLTMSGTSTVTAFDSIADGAVREIHHTGIHTLTHNATSMICIGNASITTLAGDVSTWRSLGGGNWRMIGYQAFSGRALLPPVGNVLIGAGPFVAGHLAVFADTTGLNLIDGGAVPTGGGGGGTATSVAGFPLMQI